VKSDYMLSGKPKVSQVRLVSNECVVFREMDLFEDRFFVRSSYTWNNSKLDGLFVNDVYFYLSN
jgi:hypothetical protein